MRIDKASYAIFDFETTGLYPYSGDKICEIGAIRMAGRSKRVRRFHSLVNPKRPISYGAYSVNGITGDMLKDAPTIDEVLPGFMDFIDGSVLVAYNAGFDLGFLECALGKESSLLDRYSIIDALFLARRLFRDLAGYNLGLVSQSLGIIPIEEHRALADAVMTWKIFEKELDILSDEGITAVEDVAYVRRQAVGADIKDFRVLLIERAIREKKLLNITYRSSWNNKLTHRMIVPREMRCGYDRIYIVAQCLLRNDERVFRLDGIIDAAMTK